MDVGIRDGQQETEKRDIGRERQRQTQRQKQSGREGETKFLSEV